MNSHFVLAFLWVGIIAFGIILYVILDGFDLGIGILAPFFKSSHRDIMISTIMPVWDGNETWLVFGGAALYGAFPVAFSTILPNLYIPILIMVAALLFRGVSFEFRLKDEEHRKWWDVAFFFGSIVATFIQGVMLGTFVHGFKLQPAGATIPPYDWFTPFSVTCGIALIFGYMLLGSNWLIMKTTQDLQAKCYKFSKVIIIIVAAFAALLSLWSPYIDPRLWSRWFNPQTMPYLAVLPFVTGFTFLLHWFALEKKKEYAPFFLAIVIFLCCYIGFIISSYPYIVPRVIPFWQAAAPQGSLVFMFIGACVMLPVLLYYTYHSYKIFRGKVTEVIGYH
jgi:cytochrome bd ubiquinol oxidase subunit II